MADDPVVRQQSSPGLTPEEEDREVSREEHGALKWAALVAAFAIAYLVMPIGVGILLGMLVAFVMQPAYTRIRKRVPGGWAAVTVVAVSSLTLAVSTFMVGWLFVAKGRALAQQLVDAAGPGGYNGYADRAINFIGAKTSRFGLTPEELARHTRQLANKIPERIGETANDVVGTVAETFLGAFFAMLTMHFILRNWETVSLRAQETFPLRPDYTRALFAEFRRVGRTTLMGTIVTGLAQGFFATIGYLIAGVPEPIFFGVATAIASLVPAVGTMLVWVPAGIILILTGHPLGGIFELAWGLLFVVAFSDYYVRPRLVGGEGRTPSLVTFAALFGGVEVFGLKGLILGPVLMSIAIAVLRLYATETRLRRHIARPSMSSETPPPSITTPQV